VWAFGQGSANVFWGHGKTWRIYVVGLNFISFAAILLLLEWHNSILELHVCLELHIKNAATTTATFGLRFNTSLYGKYYSVGYIQVVVLCTTTQTTGF